MTKMAPLSRNLSSTRKKDKKVSVSVTNWMLGGSLLTGMSTSSMRCVASLNSDNDHVLSNSAKEKKEGKMECKKDDKAESKKEKSKDGKEKEACEKCKSCGKKVPFSSSSEDEKSADKIPDTAKEKKGGSGDSAGIGWTSDQDTKIKDMKADNKSWKDIALEVGASKKGVQYRYKELTKGDKEKIPEGEKKDGEEKSTWKKHGGDDTSGWTTIVDDDALFGVENANMPEFGALFDDPDEGKGDGEGVKKHKEKSAGGRETRETADVDWSENVSGGKPTDEGKKQKDGENTRSKQQNNSGGNYWESNNSGTTNTSYPTSTSWNPDNNCGSYNKSYRFNDSGSGFGAPFIDTPTPSPSQDFGSGVGSGGVGKLKPDGVWSEDDCEVLEWLMTRHEEDKWLHIQSGFYNWTKRMVSWEIIEQKFRDDGAL